MRTLGTSVNHAVASVRWAVHEPAKVLWTLVAMALSFTLIGVGGTYLYSSASFGLKAHGTVLGLLGLLNVWALATLSRGMDRRAWMTHRWTSVITSFYAFACTVVTLMLDPNPTIFWYALASALSVLLLVLSPPFGHQDLHNKELTTDSSHCA